MKIVEIKRDGGHEMLVIPVEGIELKLCSYGRKEKLYDFMYKMKTILDCHFEFKFNSMHLDIVLACKLPSDYLLAVFVIRKVAGNVEQSTFIADQVFTEKDEQSDSCQETMFT